MMQAALGGSRTTAVVGLTATGLFLSSRGSYLSTVTGGGSAVGPIAPTKPHQVAFGVNPDNPSENRGGGSGSLAPFAKPRIRDDPWYWLRDE